MPWLAVGYDNKELKDMCVGPEPAMEVLPRLTLTVRRYNDLLDVEGIPTLALYGPDGVLITDEGVYARFTRHIPTLTSVINSRRKRARRPRGRRLPLGSTRRQEHQLRHTPAARPCVMARLDSIPSPFPDDVIKPINTQSCVCVMAEACDESFKQQLLATLEPLCLDASNTVKCVRSAL
jgi:hypothetical protein